MFDELVTLFRTSDGQVFNNDTSASNHHDNISEQSHQSTSRFHKIERSYDGGKTWF